ncbi:MAG: RsmE family RNA methyltransferase [Candidatus Omnitrophota bacterium]
MRFYVNPESIDKEKNLIEIRDRDEIHHIKDVMRLKKGLIVTLFDGRGNEYLGAIDSISDRAITIKIKQSLERNISLPYNITLYQAVPKKANMDLIVEKAVELGVSKIIPLITERTILKDISENRLERWRRIAKEASKQCGRSLLPEVASPKYFKDAVDEIEYFDLVVFTALIENKTPLKKILADKKPKNIVVFVGPEGDFSPSEIDLMKKKNIQVASLGPLVLKVGTATIYVLSCLNYEY